jgi:hypothetical protein
MPILEDLKLTAKEGWAWILFNALGIGTYLAIESWIFAPRIPEEAFNGIDQICYWTTMEFPLLAFCFGVDMTWLLMSRKSLFFRRQLAICLLMSGVWGSVLVCDPIAVKIVMILMAMIDGRAWNHH